MPRVICPNCHEAFDVVNGNGSDMSIHVCNNSNEIIGTLVPTNNTQANIGESIMPATNNTTSNNNTNTGVNAMPTTNNGVNAMNNTSEIAILMAMINEYKNTHQNEVSAAVTDNSVYDGATQSITNDVTVDGGLFAKTSKYYGKELCGFMYNPFMVSRFLPAQFRNLMHSYDRNVDLGIKTTVSLMDSIYFMIDECKRLALMEKKDAIAFAERKQFWSVEDARDIFKDYISKVQLNIEDAKARAVKLERRIGKRAKYIKVFGKKYNITFDVKVPVNGSARDAYTEVTIDWKYERVLKSILAELNKCESYEDLYKVMSFRKKEFVKLPSAYSRRYLGNGQWTSVLENKSNTLSKVFLDGYKRKGAYYTIKDLIMFHSGVYKNLSGRDAVALLRKKLDDGTAGYIFYAELKSMIPSSY